MHKDHWMRLDHSQAFRKRLEVALEEARQKLEMACRDSNDPKVKAAYEAWETGRGYMRAFERGESEQSNGNERATADE